MEQTDIFKRIVQRLDGLKFNVRPTIRSSKGKWVKVIDIRGLKQDQIHNDYIDEAIRIVVEEAKLNE